MYAAAAFRAPLVEIATQYETATGNKVRLIFDTAGATEQGFRRDPEAALLITTLTLINEAEKMGMLKDGATYPLGDSLAGIAFSPGSLKPDISTPEKLKAALLVSKRIAFSDPARGATVGIHFMKVIEELGVRDEVLRKATVAKDGIETMRLVLEEKVDIGITQLSEILQASRDAVRVRITNTGRRTGTEVAQLYLGMPAAANEPPNQLKGFQKVSLAPGQSKTVTFRLTSRDLSAWDGTWRVRPGTYKVAVGSSSRDFSATGRFTVGG